MKRLIKTILNNFSITIGRKNTGYEKNTIALQKIFLKYKSYTMIPEAAYVGNLKLAANASFIEGDIYECGVWKGGMIGGIATLLGNKKKYYLFDSFEGLPPAGEADGEAAIQWQGNKNDDSYYDNCSADEGFAIKAMDIAKVKYIIKKGWFSDTLPSINSPTPIALLRLDSDWYESTLSCLTHLYPLVNNNGIIIIDDYYAWDGCSKAVHDYLSSISSVSRLYKSEDGIAYIIKKDKYEN